MKQTISVVEAAEIKGCSNSTIYHWIHQGKIKANKIKGKWQITKNKKWKVAKKLQRQNVLHKNIPFTTHSETHEPQDVESLKEQILILEWTVQNLERSCEKFISQIDILSETNKNFAETVKQNCERIIYLEAILYQSDQALSVSCV